MHGALLLKQTSSLFWSSLIKNWNKSESPAPLGERKKIDMIAAHDSVSYSFNTTKLLLNAYLFTGLKFTYSIVKGIRMVMRVVH